MPPPQPPIELPANREGLVACETEIVRKKGAKGKVYTITPAPQKAEDEDELTSKPRSHWRRQSLFKGVAIKARRFKRTGFRNW